MVTPLRIALALLALSFVGAVPDTARGQVTVTIDPALTPTPILRAVGPPRPMGAMRFPDGQRVEFVEDELIVHVEPAQKLKRFLGTYRGEVVRRDRRPPGRRRAARTGRWLLVRADPGRSRLDDLAGNLGRLGVSGEVAFSSERSARTVALFLREAHRSVSLNLGVRMEAIEEHPSSILPSGTISYLDASTWTWMTEDDDPNAPGSQGLSIGVVRAWDYLRYQGVQSGSVINRPFVAIVDNGFALNSDGRPSGGNLDFDNSSSAPRQVDVAAHDGQAGGQSPLLCGGAPCLWHGTDVFGVAAAYPRNRYGSAGTGGGFVRPLLVRIGTDAFTVADGIRAAALRGASVINMSGDFRCGGAHFFCALPPDDIYTMIYEAVAFARSSRAVVLAAAGNEGLPLDMVVGPVVRRLDVYPCRTPGVICVGGVDGAGMNMYNYGAPVDISAPGCVLSTIDPVSAAADNNNVGIDELASFCGTSAATPFIAGIVGLMKAAAPSISTETVLTALQANANPSPDPLVPRGYVDALRAVEAVLPNARPLLSDIKPARGTTIGWNRHPTLSATYRDPEVSDAIEDQYRWAGSVSFRSNRDGLLCTATRPPYSCTSMRDELSLGSHTILVRALDPFGASRLRTTRIDVVNRPPTINIGSPSGEERLYSHIPIRLTALVSDPDENVANIRVNWSSSRAGGLGSGSILEVMLPAGRQVLTATAVDGKGATDTATRTIEVISGAGKPLPVISAPEGTYFSPGETVTLLGKATDPEDGELSGRSLRWYSDIDGFLGIGKTLKVVLSGPESPCYPEYRRHQVRLVARDRDGNRAIAYQRISVGQVC
jgi:serine protease